MRIVSDIEGLERVAGPGTSVTVISSRQTPGRWARNLRLLRAALGTDYLVIHFELTGVVFFAGLFALIPFHRCRLITLDFFVVDPPAWQLPLVKWSLRRIDRLLVYFRDSARFKIRYGLPRGKFRYIPFKINSWELVQRTPISDEGYIFVGGRSRRDFRTLLDAVKDLEYPVKVLTAHEADLRPHGSTLEGLAVPPNVEIFYNDSDSAVFVDMIARSRLVVLPIVKNTAVQAGISVCLLGMALRKCVVTSEALGISDVLAHGQVCIIPSGDARILRETIDVLFSDDELRCRFADAGYRYARPLGGEDQLRISVLHAIGATTIAPPVSMD